MNQNIYIWMQSTKKFFVCTQGWKQLNTLDAIEVHEHIKVVQ